MEKEVSCESSRGYPVGFSRTQCAEHAAVEQDVVVMIRGEALLAVFWL
jgi:hypothetical protein